MIKKQTQLSEVLKLQHPCSCNACNHGCNMGSGFLANDDIPKIAKFLKITEQELKEKYVDEVEKFNTKLSRPKLGKYPYGKCIFFENGCKIHQVKPLECKIAMPCKEYGEELIIWFTLNHFVNPTDPESIRQFNAYLKSGGKTLDGGQLTDLVPDKKIREKILKYEVLK